MAVRLSGSENASHSITRSVESPKCAAPCMSITALNKLRNLKSEMGVHLDLPIDKYPPF